jgi:integrase
MSTRIEWTDETVNVVDVRDATFATSSDSSTSTMNADRRTRRQRPPAALVLATPAPIAMFSPTVARHADVALELRKSVIRDSSRATYDRINVTFERYCTEHQLDSYDPRTVELFIASRVDANEKHTTLRTRIAAIVSRATQAGYPSPLDDPMVLLVARNGLRKLKIEQAGKTKKSDAAIFEALPKLVAAASGPTRLRDIALVLFGFAIGRRGSELADIDVEHIHRFSNGLVVSIPRSKTNKSSTPETVGVPIIPGHPLCPVAALDAWLSSASITTGPVFITLSPVNGRGGRRIRREDISRRLDQLAAAAGLSDNFTSHALRRGVVTSAENRGVSRALTRSLTGWKSDAMFAEYVDLQDRIAASPLTRIYTTSPPSPLPFDAPETA